jgi:hypothetical protein
MNPVPLSDALCDSLIRLVDSVFNLVQIRLQVTLDSFFVKLLLLHTLALPRGSISVLLLIIILIML